MFDNDLIKLTDILKLKKLTVATAESCTGGLLSSRFTDISGSSDFVKLNFVTYANEAKTSILNVSEEILNSYGAVSPECAKAMVTGLKEKVGADICICTTGIAGPTGGTKEKPVGLMYVGVYYENNIYVEKIQLNPLLPRKIMKFMFTQMAIKFALNIVQN